MQRSMGPKTPVPVDNSTSQLLYQWLSLTVEEGQKDAKSEDTKKLAVNVSPRMSAK